MLLKGFSLILLLCEILMDLGSNGMKTKNAIFSSSSSSSLIHSLGCLECTLEIFMNFIFFSSFALLPILSSFSALNCVLALTCDPNCTNFSTYENFTWDLSHKNLEWCEEEMKRRNSRCIKCKLKTCRCTNWNFSVSCPQHTHRRASLPR